MADSESVSPLPDAAHQPLTVLRFPFLRLAGSVLWATMMLSMGVGVANRFYAGSEYLYYERVGFGPHIIVFALFVVGVACKWTLKTHGQKPIEVPPWDRLNWALATVAVLIFCLNMMLVVIDLRPSRVGVVLPANEWNYLQSSDQQFRISVPTRWRPWRQIHHPESLVFVSDPATGAAFLVRPMSKQMEREDVPLDLRLIEFDFPIVQQDVTKVAQRAAVVRIQEGVYLKQLVYLVKHDDQVLRFAFVTRTELFDAYRPMFEEIMKTVQFSQD